ncbi:MAG: tetratricopeptide repeat protein, partial [Planctomycetaceae bacterium]|nr:tetratricopeptide repeat protein [Planctomycetaceae bacterium]
MVDVPDENWNPERDGAHELVERAWEIGDDEPEEAQRLFERALAAAPDSPEVLANAARFLSSFEDKRARALELFARAVELVPDDAIVLHDAGLCAERQGEFERAERWL